MLFTSFGVINRWASCASESCGTLGWGHTFPSLPSCCLPATATGRHYVISGQHRVAACKKFRDIQTAANRTIPKWATQFRCKVIKDTIPLSQMEEIAGRAQAAQLTVTGFSFADTMRKLMDEHSRLTRQAGGHPPSKAEVLRHTYRKTGKNLLTDGTEVCTCQSCSPLLPCDCPGACFSILKKSSMIVNVPAYVFS